MSGVKHTPWEHPGTKLYAVFNGHYWDVCVGPNEFSHTVGSCHRNRPLGYDLDGAERYARLFAAAPDLLEALEWLVETSGDPDSAHLGRARDNATSVIARARGEQDGGGE
ncbi:hypothetical protein [Brevundimonas diminuta]|uniref:hypothetical protein n=1 Tax=Brevundimonas diminuta TaxID=293 RepID=UPI000207ED00|nr:hypothetical protein [Brevundimonas diminuta]EGF96786.1 hypothetical protein BDIM_05940 [Brevundimonas diminuta ATCC 11568]OWR16569.1 hypothetical protein CD944_16240 [Brevundimonas diminuta]WQE44822.1 hypothetical protein U0020_14680 [Brevundimonas diminuta]SUW17335.1 Uncharacterised protein [Brevundimonas diminuta]